MSSFTLKLIGITSMLADHIGKAFFPEQQWLTLIGRLAFPIFAFGIAEGYLHTHDINKYFKRLAVFALISQIPYMLFNSIISANYWQSTNVIFTLLLGLAAIFFLDRSSNKAIGFLITLALCIIAELVHADYSAYGISVVLLFYFLSQTMREKTFQHKKNPHIRHISCFQRTYFVKISLPSINHWSIYSLYTNNPLHYSLLRTNSVI